MRGAKLEVSIMTGNRLFNWTGWIACLLCVTTACIGDPTSSSKDLDGDGYNDNGPDCAPADPAIHPGAAEICDGADNDCDGGTDIDPRDGTVYHLDQDGDGFGDPEEIDSFCALPGGYAANGDDCDDADPESYPEALERCDEKDNDCDVGIDEGLPTSSWYIDADGDDYGVPGPSVEACGQPKGYAGNTEDCDDEASVSHPGAVERCDGADNDCDTQIDEELPVDAWYPDADEDGYGSPEGSIVYCDEPPGYVGNDQDCDDGDAETNPAALEVCNGLDDDCDLEVDDGLLIVYYEDTDEDGYGADSRSTLRCDGVPVGYSRLGGDCDDTTASIHPGERETPYDGIDQDCAGGDLTDVDGDGYAASQVGGLDCDDEKASIRPGVEDVCDGVDNDCDRYVDQVVRFMWDRDKDGYGDAESPVQTACAYPVDGGYTTTSRGDCDDGDSSMHPGAAEASATDGRDQDCGGTDGVDPHVGLSAGSYSTIEGAIEAADASKAVTVWVGPGVYYPSRTIELANRYISMISTTTSIKTIIDGSQNKTVILLSNTNLDNIGLLDGFSIVNGLNESGGGLYIYKSNQVIRNCIIRNNRAASGGAFYHASGSAKIQNCVIYQNMATEGAGLYVEFGSPLLENVKLTSNKGSGPASKGAGIYMLSGSAAIHNSVISDNTGGSGTIFQGKASSLILNNSILAFNNETNLHTDTTSTDSYSCHNSIIYNPEDMSNYSPPTLTFSNDVFFNNPAFFYLLPDYTSNDDFHLLLGPTSPAIDSGSPDITDPDGTRSDMGIYGGPLGGSWDLDGDLYPDYFWPGTLCDAPPGFDHRAYDANDMDPSIHLPATPCP